MDKTFDLALLFAVSMIKNIVNSGFEINLSLSIYIASVEN